MPDSKEVSEVVLRWVAGRALRGLLLADRMVAKGGRTDARVCFRCSGRLLLDRLVGEVRAVMTGGGERVDGGMGFRCNGRLLLERFVEEVRGIMTGGSGRISSGKRVQWLGYGWGGEGLWVGGSGNWVRDWRP